MGVGKSVCSYVPGGQEGSDFLPPTLAVDGEAVEEEELLFKGPATRALDGAVWRGVGFCRRRGWFAGRCAGFHVIQLGRCRDLWAGTEFAHGAGLPAEPFLRCGVVDREVAGHVGVLVGIARPEAFQRQGATAVDVVAAAHGCWSCF